MKCIENQGKTEQKEKIQKMKNVTKSMGRGNPESSEGRGQRFKSSRVRQCFQ